MQVYAGNRNFKPRQQRSKCSYTGMVVECFSSLGNLQLRIRTILSQK